MEGRPIGRASYHSYGGAVDSMSPYPPPYHPEGPPSRSMITNGPTEEEELAQEAKTVKKNVVVLCMALFVLLTSFNGMAMLESTLNPGAGSISLACLYAAMVVMSLFFSTWIINEISVKWAIFFGMWGYIIYVVAQFCPSSDGLIISGIILGVGASPMWIAFSTYISESGKRLAAIRNENRDIFLGQIFAFSHLFGMLSYVAGGLVASSILSVNAKKPNLTEKDLYKCGTNFCPNSNLNADLSLLAPVDANVVTTFVGVMLGLALLGAYIVGYSVDPLIRFDDNGKPVTVLEKIGMDAIKSNLGVLCSGKVFLLFVFCLWIGSSHSYMVGDFNVAYVACRYGIHMIGYRVLIFAASSMTSCLLLIGCIKLKGRFPMFIGAGLLNYGAMGLMFYWSKFPHEEYILYVIPVMWGLADGVWQTQIRALLAVIYPDYVVEAFSALGLLEALGFVLNYALQPFLCNSSKVILLAAMLGLGFIGYCILEVLLHRKRDRGEEANDEGSRSPVPSAPSH